MSKRFASLRLMAWLVVLASPVVARAQALADRVPADTILYVGWRGVEAPGPGYEGSHLQDVLKNSNLPKVVGELLPAVLDRVAMEGKDAAEIVEVVRAIGGPLWRHPTAIALVSVTLVPRAPPQPKWVVLCQAGNEALAMAAKVQLLIDKSRSTSPIKVINRGGLVAVVFGYDKPEEALVDAGPNASSLANNPAFTKSLGQVSADAFVTAYVDLERGLNLVNLSMIRTPPEARKKWSTIRDKLGLDGIKRGIWTEGFDGKDWATRMFIDAPAPRAGLLGALLEGKPLSPEILQAIPENANVAGAMHFDVAGLIDALREGITAVDPESGRKLNEAIEQANQTLGMDIQRVLVSSLGDEWAYYNDPTVAGNGIVGLTLVNRLKNPPAAQSALERLEKFVNETAARELAKEKVTIAFQQVKIGEATVHYLAVPLISPAWTIKNGNLYLALYPETVGAAAAHIPGVSRSITTNPAFLALAQRLGDHPVSSFSFTDLPKLAPENYATWLVLSHVLNVADLFGVPAPVVVLPPLKKLLANLSPAGEISWTDADGVHALGITPFPGADLFASNPGMFMIGEMAVAAGYLIPSLNSRRYAPPREIDVYPPLPGRPTTRLFEEDPFPTTRPSPPFIRIPSTTQPAPTLPPGADAGPHKDPAAWENVEQSFQLADLGIAIIKADAYKKDHPGDGTAALNAMIDNALERLWWSRITGLCLERSKLNNEIKEKTKDIREETSDAFKRVLANERKQLEMKRDEVQLQLVSDMGYTGIDAPPINDKDLMEILRIVRDAEKFGDWKKITLNFIIKNHGQVPWNT